HAERSGNVLRERQPHAGKFGEDGSSFSDEALASGDEHVVGKAFPALAQLTRQAKQTVSIRGGGQGCVEGTDPVGRPGGLAQGFGRSADLALHLSTPSVEPIVLDSDFLTCSTSRRTGPVNLGIGHFGLT